MSFHLRTASVYMVSLGCPRNLVDSEVMLGILLKAGYTVAHDLESATHIIVNTCSFLEASRKESLETIGTLLQQLSSDAKVIVTGCMVSSHKELLQSTFPQIRHFLGSGDVASILTLVESEEESCQLIENRSYLEVGEIPRQISTPKHYAYLKIAEGCRKRCAYCIIPEIKGPLQSKTVDRCLHEFRLLLEKGTKEIILIAQDLGDFGKERGLRRTEGLRELLSILLKEKGDFWLRLLYLYPDEIDDDLIDIMASDRRLCAYLDMPIQHISNRILRSMRRATTGEAIRATIARLRERLPHISIRTSLIAGFPGETDEDHQALVAFLKESALDQVGVFTYSNEPKAASFHLPNHVEEHVKAARREELMEEQKKIVEAKNHRFLKKRLRVLIDGFHPESDLLLVARHEGQAPDIDSSIIINDRRNVRAIGEFHDLLVEGVSGYDLVGRVVS